MARKAFVFIAAIAVAALAGPTGGALSAQQDTIQDMTGVARDAAARPDEPIRDWAAGFARRSGCDLRVEADGGRYERIALPTAAGRHELERTQDCVLELLRSLMQPPSR